MLNLTQHAATPEQIEAGVRDLAAEQRAELSALLTFAERPTRAEVIARAAEIAAFATQHVWEGEPVMIGGAPFLMGALEAALWRDADEGCIAPYYAFSVRETEEQNQPDGSVRKVAVFRHAGFVTGWCDGTESDY